MGWSGKTSATQITTLGVTELFFDEIIGPSGSGETFHVQVEIDFAALADAVTVRVYATLDDATETWSTRPISSVRLLQVDDDPGVADFTLADFYKCRIGVQVVDGGGTTTVADMRYRSDQVELAP